MLQSRWTDTKQRVLHVACKISQESQHNRLWNQLIHRLILRHKPLLLALILQLSTKFISRDAHKLLQAPAEVSIWWCVSCRFVEGHTLHDICTRGSIEERISLDMPSNCMYHMLDMPCGRRADLPVAWRGSRHNTCRICQSSSPEHLCYIL